MPSAGPKRMMKETFFPTPIYFTDLQGAEALNADLAAHIRAWRDQDPGGTFRTNLPQLGGWHSATDMHARAEYGALTREIFELVQGIFDEQGYDPDFEPACDSMWANVNPRYTFNRAHTHPHALWSGVYYVQTPPDCGLLYFTDPRPQAHVLTPYFDPKRRSAHTFNEVYFQPLAGRLLAFPAWLVHAVQPNLCDRNGDAGERISVSFNFHQRRKGAGAASPGRREVVRADLGD